MTEAEIEADQPLDEMFEPQDEPLGDPAPIEEPQPEGGSIGDEDAWLVDPEDIITEDIAYQSYMAIVHLSLCHVSLFPLGFIIKARTGFANPIDKQFWAIGAFWQTSIYLGAVLLGYFLIPEFFSEWSWMPLAAEILVVLPFAVYNYISMTTPTNSYGSNTPQSLALMFYAEFILFSAYLLWMNWENSLIYQTEFSTMDNTFEQLNDVNEI